jgi:hypothetical protein
MNQDELKDELPDTLRFSERHRWNEFECLLYHLPIKQI